MTRSLEDRVLHWWPGYWCGFLFGAQFGAVMTAAVLLWWLA